MGFIEKVHKNILMFVLDPFDIVCTYGVGKILCDFLNVEEHWKLK